MVSLPFILSNGQAPQVQKGDSIKVGDVLAKKTANGYSHILLGDALSVKPKSVSKYVTVVPGDAIRDGDTLALKKGLFKEDRVLSEVAGTVVAFERDSGELVIQPLGEKITPSLDELRSPVDGKVIVCDNDQIVIETDKDVIVGEKGTGTDREGKLKTIQAEGRGDTPSPLPALDANLEGYILLLPICDRDVLLKAAGVDVAGVITGKVEASDIEYLEKRNMNLPVIQVNENDMKKMIKWVGKKVYIDGSRRTILFLHA